MDKIRQLENLLWQQTHGWHPYTCGNKSSHKPLYFWVDRLLCHDCNYEQPFDLENVGDWFSEDDPDKDNRLMQLFK
ncbi:hypothetical protein LCGC14_1882180 [marine sediment metagenome]|uniref:Uncharacterized protein n=1 Tax=marine sediment metagenome TaxID=412755 RepID=A0A0F9J0B6_9ZZZZ